MWSRGWSSSVPFAGMIMAIMAQASTMVVNKVAMSGGTNKFVLAFYGNSLSTFLLLPSLLLLRRPSCPSPTSSLLLKLFVLSLIGFMAQIFGYLGIDYSSPTLSTALMNLIPAFTFILAIIFRMERLAWKSSSGQAKIVGTIVSIGGAFLVTFYKGPPLSVSTTTLKLHLSPYSRWAVGGLFSAGDAFMTSLWYIVQAMILGDYPVVLIIMFYLFLYGTVLGALLSLVTVRDPDAWALKADIGLLAVIYSAVVGTVLRITTTTWCVKKRGPVFVAMFKPLAIIFAVVLGVIFSGDPLCRGSLIGAIVIVGGFYAVTWGKAKEVEDMAGGPKASEALPQTSQKVPLLIAQEQR
ncbi:WAT1-related protein At5g40240-like [Punica granatum]|uniref:WAT1-related protein At5g40240-like n=2 Tax=Punica granatum TaxID=22663 RepID=A0A6P8E6M4_PUNGR|nr:WAT1-related protein At5g40240-like [Punica granatum]XP_031402189.1 WAT1-related protein At5g40240-like [Punica granatum]PKI49953.1 hypothetical protein CRG98_029661 [Punica granatum]